MHSIRKKIPAVLLALVMAGVLSLSVVSATLPALTPPPTDGYTVGDILDPGCAPTDIDCLINPASFRGASYGNSVTIGHNNEVLYMDGSGNLTSDALFTRDSSTNHTNITRDFSYSADTISVEVAPALVLDNVFGSFNDGDTVLNTTDGTSTATVIKSLQGAGYVLIVSNVSGSFNNDDFILNTTDGTSTAQLQMFSSTFNPGDTWESFNIINSNHTASGNIVGVNGDTYDLGTASFGSVSQYDLLFDTLSGQPSKIVGVISVSSISNLGSITTGLISDNNYAGFGIQGSYLHQSDGITSMDFGVFDLSGLGGARTTAGIVSVDQNTGAATTFIANPYGQGLSLGNQDSSGNHSDFSLGQGSFSLSSEYNGMGGSRVGFSANGYTPSWFGNSNTFHLPTYTPAQDQVLSVSSVSGNEIYLDWVNAGTGTNPWSAYTVPADGASGQILSTDGSGILSWIDAGGVFPDQTNHDGEFLTTNSGILSWTSNIGSYVPLSYMGANNGVATLDANGKIPSSQLAALAINNSFVVGSEVDMLALPANTGDIVVRTDISSTFVLSGNDPTILSNWVQLLWQPTVVSINGLAGVVNLTTDNINEGTTNLYFTNSRVNTAIAAYLPTQTGNAGRVLSTDGAGNLSWVTQSGGGGSGTGPIYTNSVASLFTSDIGAGEGSTLIGGNIFFGYSAGNGATSVSYSNFFGQNSGNGAISASNSSFFGYESGFSAENAANSNFFGNYAGHYATDASNSNFFGQNSGNGASGAFNSNFFGQNSGSGASSAYNSNFFGRNSGSNATGAHDSNLFGESAGYQADNAYYAICCRVPSKSSVLF